MDVEKGIARVAQIASGRRISQLDVFELRNVVFRDGLVTREEAEAILALNDACAEKSPEWCAFFIEALTDYLVHQERPSGYVSAMNADWLIDRLSRDGRIDTRTELELLVRILEAAKFSTEQLVGFALNQVKLAVVNGEGPLIDGSDLLPGTIDKAEVDLLRRILYAFGGDGNIAITRAEAEVLFDINDAVAGSTNDASWNDLFVKAIVNFLMCASGYEAPTREVALRQENFIDDTDADIAGFMARMAQAGGRELLSAYRESVDVDADWETRKQWQDSRRRQAERRRSEEARWLAERIGRSGHIHDNELALIRIIKDSAAPVDPALEALLKRLPDACQRAAAIRSTSPLSFSMS